MIILHIGMHKTGTTSIQRYLHDHRELLEENGYGLFVGGLRNPTNHTELHLACIRDERDSFGKYNNPGLVIDSEFRENIRSRVQKLINDQKFQNQIFSNEALSWLRFDDELERLKYIFGPAANNIRIIICLRNKVDFLNSYRKQILKRPNRYPSDNKKSVLYVEADTWLTDYDEIIRLYSNAFGDKSITIINYEEAISVYGNIIPAFLKAAEIEALDWPDKRSYFLNKSEGD